jgi:hypothetical protein
MKTMISLLLTLSAIVPLAPTPDNPPAPTPVGQVAPTP